MDIAGIDWKLVAVVGGVVFGATAFIPYFFDILKRQTEPHVYTWLIWIITQGTAVAGVWYGGGGIGALGLTIGTILMVGILLLSFKYGTKNITRSDTITLIAALAGVVLWWQLHEPLLAVLVVTVIDALGYIPTVRKSYQEPWSETISSWFLFICGNLFSLAALDAYNILTVLYIAVITAANILLVSFLLMRRRMVPKPL